MFIGLALGAQNPLPWSDGNFPSTLINVFKADNVSWLQNGDSIYSAFKVEDKYYASCVKVVSRDMVFLMAFGNTGTGTVQLSDVDSVSIVGYDDKIPVKVGFNNKETIYWGVCRDGIIYKLNLISKKVGKYGEEGKFMLTDSIVDILDNPYYSVNPVWPLNINYRIKKPEKLNRDYFLYNLAFTGGKDWRLQYPKYLSGLKWEMYYGSSKVTNDKKGFLNQAKFRFTQADVDRGYILLKLTGTPYKNSRSADTSRVYKIYFQ